MVFMSSSSLGCYGALIYTGIRDSVHPELIDNKIIPCCSGDDVDTLAHGLPMSLNSHVHPTIVIL